MKRTLSDPEDPFSQTINPSISSSQTWSQSSPNLSQETKAVNRQIKKTIYITNILELNDRIQDCQVDVIGVATERGKLETRTNRNGEIIYRRNLVLEDPSGKVVVSLKGQIAQDFGNCDGYPVVSVEHSAVKTLKRMPKLLELIHAKHGDSSSESDFGSTVSTPTSEVSPPFGNGSQRKKKCTNSASCDKYLRDQRYAKELEYCQGEVIPPFEIQSPRKKQKLNGASCDGNDQKYTKEPGPKPVVNIVNVVYLAANDSSRVTIDPLHDKTAKLHAWFQSHQRKTWHDNPDAPMDTCFDQDILILPKILDITESEDVYPMNTKPRGQALIINIQEFVGEPLKKRYGSERDVVNLTKVLKDYLGFQVTQLSNLKKIDFLNALDNFAQNTSHLSGSMAVIAIFSHGTWSEGSTDGYIEPSDPITTGYIRIEDIYQKFNNKNCPNLLHKPKWFLFQCCRGHETDYGISVPGTTTATESEMQTDATLIASPGKPESFRILPTYHDFLISHSTLPGYTSSRSPRDGSWFIQTLLEVFTKYLPVLHTMELVRLLRKVERKLGEKTRRDYEKQTCETRHFGLKEIYFDNWNEDQEKDAISCAESCPW